MRAPYGMELAPYGVINYVLFVRNKGSQDDWIWVNDCAETVISSPTHASTNNHGSGHSGGRAIGRSATSYFDRPSNLSKSCR